MEPFSPLTHTNPYPMGQTPRHGAENGHGGHAWEVKSPGMPARMHAPDFSSLIYPMPSPQTQKSPHFWGLDGGNGGGLVAGGG